MTSKSSSGLRIGESRLVSRGPTGTIITPANLEFLSRRRKTSHRFRQPVTVILLVLKSLLRFEVFKVGY